MHIGRRKHGDLDGDRGVCDLAEAIGVMAPGEGTPEQAGAQVLVNVKFPVAVPKPVTNI